MDLVLQLKHLLVELLEVLVGFFDVQLVHDAVLKKLRGCDSTHPAFFGVLLIESERSKEVHDGGGTARLCRAAVDVAE